MSKQELINTADAAEILGISSTTLRIWRTQGKGPTYLKVGALVWYEPDVVRNWRAAQVRTSTSQKAHILASA